MIIIVGESSLLMYNCSDHSLRKPLVEKGEHPALRSPGERKPQGERVEKLILDHRHWHLNDRMEKLVLDLGWCQGPMHIDDLLLCHRDGHLHNHLLLLPNLFLLLRGDLHVLVVDDVRHVHDLLLGHRHWLRQILVEHVVKGLLRSLLLGGGFLLLLGLLSSLCCLLGLAVLLGILLLRGLHGGRDDEHSLLEGGSASLR